MTKIVLIQPKVLGFNPSYWEALGIGYICSFIKREHKESSYSKFHYSGDLDIEFYSGFYDCDDLIIDACLDADIVGFSCTSPQMKHALSMGEKIMDNVLEKPPFIVFGGVHPSALPRETLGLYPVDAVIVGEGELPFSLFVEVPRIAIYGPNLIENLDSIPFPDRETIKNERHIQTAYKETGERITSMTTSRGCPYRCQFCCSHVVHGRKPRFRSPDNILEEMGLIYKWYNLDFIKFNDDTFNLDPWRCIDFAVAKVNYGLDHIKFGANIHALRLTSTVKTMWEQLADTNMREAWIGVESGSQCILNDMKKGLTIDIIKDTFKFLKELGIKTRAYFLLGMPNETREDIELTKKLAIEIDADITGFTCLAPYPGSEIYELYKDELNLKDVDWSQVDEYMNSVWHTDNFSNEELKSIQSDLVKYFQDKITFRQRTK